MVERQKADRVANEWNKIKSMAHNRQTIRLQQNTTHCRNEQEPVTRVLPATQNTNEHARIRCPFV